MPARKKYSPPSPFMAGLKSRCPRCGRGRLFSGYLTIAPRCRVCKLNFGFADSGDGPAVFIVLIAGFFIVVAVLIVEVRYQPPYWVHAALWLPLTGILSLGAAQAGQGDAGGAPIPAQCPRGPVGQALGQEFET
ncbi:hypothetical protein BMS3Bbin10_00198 [bacterium BMS3Bbin10]|nr:hypothetical protein BMS3Bbin10_00198 [bacterium BMS3Bbin10]